MAFQLKIKEKFRENNWLSPNRPFDAKNGNQKINPNLNLTNDRAAFEFWIDYFEERNIDWIGTRTRRKESTQIWVQQIKG